MPAHATVIPAEEAAGTHCAHCAEVTGQEEGGAARPSSVRTREATKRLLTHGHRRSLPRAACGARPGCGQRRWPAASAEREAEPGQGTARREEGRGTGHRLEPLLQQAAARRAPRLPSPASGDNRAGAANTERGGALPLQESPPARPDRRPSAARSGPPGPGRGQTLSCTDARMKAPSPRPPNLSVPPGQHLPCSASSECARAVQPRAERGCPCVLGHTSPFPTHSPRQVRSEAPHCRASSDPGAHGSPRLGRGLPHAAPRRVPKGHAALPVPALIPQRHRELFTGAAASPGSYPSSPRRTAGTAHRPQPYRGAPDPRVGRPPPAATLEERLLPAAPQN